jgi:hypothetical protein
MKDLTHIKRFNESEDKGGYIITGESGMNRDVLYFVNDEDGITACNKDVSKRPDDLDKEKIFVDRKSAEKFKKGLRNWRDDVRWYIESIKRFNENSEMVEDDVIDSELFELKLTKEEVLKLKRCLSSLYKNHTPDGGSLSFASQLEDKLSEFLK